MYKLYLRFLKGIFTSIIGYEVKFIIFNWNYFVSEIVMFWKFFSLIKYEVVLEVI